MKPLFPLKFLISFKLWQQCVQRYNHMTLPAIVFQGFLCFCVHILSYQAFYITEAWFLTLELTGWVKNYLIGLYYLTLRLSCGISKLFHRCIKYFLPFVRNSLSLSVIFTENHIILQHYQRPYIAQYNNYTCKQCILCFLLHN